jgi:hypothetical protein
MALLWSKFREGVVPLLDSIPEIVESGKKVGRSDAAKKKTGSPALKKSGASPISMNKTPLFSRKAAGTLKCPACSAIGFSNTTLVIIKSFIEPRIFIWKRTARRV